VLDDSSVGYWVLSNNLHSNWFYLTYLVSFATFTALQFLIFIYCIHLLNRQTAHISHFLSIKNLFAFSLNMVHTMSVLRFTRTSNPFPYESTCFSPPGRLYGLYICLYRHSLVTALYYPHFDESLRCGCH